MTKKELQTMITAAVRKVVKEEIKPLIETTIKREFHKILDEAESAKPSKTLMVDNVEPQGTSLISLIEDGESDSARAEINERIFKGKIPFEEKNPFADVLNQTANEVESKTGIYSNPLKQTGEQKKVVLNQPMVESASPGVVEGTPLRKDLVIMGDIEKIGIVEGMPGIEGTIKPKSNVLQKIVAKEPRTGEESNVVELPTMSAGGEGGAPKPINYDNVPIKLVKNMMKNYSGLLKKVDTKVRRPE